LLRAPYDPFTGIAIPNKFNGRLIFISDYRSEKFPKDLTLEYVDNVIASTTLRLKEEFPNKEVILVSKDRNLRLKARILGLKVENYKYDKISEENLTGIYDPLRTIEADDIEVNTMFSYNNRGKWEIPYTKHFNLRYNEGCIINDLNKNFIGLGIRKDDVIKFIDYKTVKVLGMSPKVLDDKHFIRNDEQAISMMQSMDDKIKIQVIVGKAGTGKTHIAMAAALDQVFNQERYKTIKLVKPLISKSRLGEDIGFLPGSVKRKLLPKMRPFVEKIKNFNKDQIIDFSLDRLMEEGIVELINIADIRGSDLVDSIVIFDEAQNASPFQLRTLGTRLGENSKLIVLGDPTQIDNIYLDRYSNALVHLYRQAKSAPENYIASVSLVQMVRSYASQWFEEHIDALAGKNTNAKTSK
jgi:PhoH-like ATPase